ncbi:hypothetical protein ACFXKG_19185 [Streptomyces sp. NPDC059255]|uniref:hypothetical protein n=1 Tax=Streptomyces sp. NPDC059255 TaxID=3346793 RepID=UPI003677393E
MDVAITIMALLFVAFVVLGVYACVKAVGAARRGVDRTITQARRTVEDTALRAKSLGQPGTAGELAQLRLRLRTSMRATQDALQAGVAEDASLTESIELFERLSVHGRELDDELRRLERDPDRSSVGQRLPEVRDRTERITHSADSLRWAARDRARKFAEDDLSSLSAQIDVESGALRHWSAEPAQPAAPAGPSGSTASDAWHGERGAAGAGSRPAPQSAPGERAEAIEPPDPRRGTTYPWQKQARPETTN